MLVDIDLPTQLKNETNHLYCIFTHSPIRFLGKIHARYIYTKRKAYSIIIDFTCIILHLVLLGIWL